MPRPADIALVIALLLAGCGRSEPYLHDEADQDKLPSNARHDVGFTGLWLVDQPTHALYEASYYELKKDGAMALLLSIGVDGHLKEHGETGSVARASGEPSCTFVDEANQGEWWNLDAWTLVIRGDCSDDRPREIRLRFESAPALGVDLGEPTIESVGGETGWAHDNWPWRFRVCDASQTVQTCQ